MLRNFAKQLPLQFSTGNQSSASPSTTSTNNIDTDDAVIAYEGWVEKTGPNALLRQYKRRWLVLYTNKCLKYFTSETYAECKGSIDLAFAKWIGPSQSKQIGINACKHAFKIVTVKPKRDWRFFIQTEEEKIKWINQLQAVTGYDPEQNYHKSSSISESTDICYSISPCNNNSLPEPVITLTVAEDDNVNRLDSSSSLNDSLITKNFWNKGINSLKYIASSINPMNEKRMQDLEDLVIELEGKLNEQKNEMLMELESRDEEILRLNAEIKEQKRNELNTNDNDQKNIDINDDIKEKEDQQKSILMEKIDSYDQEIRELKNFVLEKENNFHILEEKYEDIQLMNEELKEKQKRECESNLDLQMKISIDFEAQLNSMKKNVCLHCVLMVINV